MKTVTQKFPDIKKIYAWSFNATSFLLVISVFGQMPLFKRYYIADLPGLGWSGDYVFMSGMLYISSAIMAFLIPVGLSLNLFQDSIFRSEQKAQSISWIVISGAFFAGILMKIATISFGSSLPREAVFLMSMIHIGLTVLYVVGSLSLLFNGKILVPVKARITNYIKRRR